MTRILTVDDDPDILLVVRLLLEAEGYKVTALETPEEVLPELGRRRYDLAILDVMMPGMTGWQLLKRIRARQQLQDLPVMMLTATAEKAARKRAVMAGANGFLKKPFLPDDLIAHVRQTLAAADTVAAA